MRLDVYVQARPAICMLTREMHRHLLLVSQSCATHAHFRRRGHAGLPSIQQRARPVRRRK